MRKVVIDTNVLVSALLSPGGNPAKILALVLNERITVCFDSRVMMEYENVLSRPKFPFDARDIGTLLNTLVQIGTAVLAEPLESLFADSSDRKFYEVAKSAGVCLITGNDRHYPDEDDVLSPTEFLDMVQGDFFELSE